MPKIKINNISRTINMQCPGTFPRTTNDLVSACVKNFYHKVPGHSNLIGKRVYSSESKKGIASYKDQVLKFERRSSNESKSTDPQSPMKKMQNELTSRMQSKGLSKSATETVALDMINKRPLYSAPMKKFYSQKRYKTFASSSSVSIVSKRFVQKPRKKLSHLSKSMESVHSFDNRTSAFAMRSPYPMHQSIRSQSNWHAEQQLNKVNAGRLPASAAYASASLDHNINRWKTQEQARAHTQWQYPSQYRSQSQWPFGIDTKVQNVSPSKQASGAKGPVKVESATRDYSQIQSQTQIFSRSSAQAQYESQFEENQRTSRGERDDANIHPNPCSAFVPPLEENFKNDLMDFNKAVKNLISLGPRRVITQQPRRADPADPLSGWKYPTKLEVNPKTPTNIDGSGKYPKVATVMKTNVPQLKSLQAMEKALQEAKHQLNDLKRVSKVVDIDDRSEITRRLIKNALMKTKHREKTLNDSRGNKKGSDSSHHAQQDENSEMADDSEKSADQKSGNSLQEPQSMNESSCVLLAKVLRNQGKEFTDLFYLGSSERAQKRKQYVSDPRIWTNPNSVIGHFTPSSPRGETPEKHQQKQHKHREQSQSRRHQQDQNQQTRFKESEKAELGYQQSQHKRDESHNQHEQEREYQQDQQSFLRFQQKCQQHQPTSQAKNDSKQHLRFEKQQEQEETNEEMRADQKSPTTSFARVTQEPPLAGLQALVQSCPQSRAFLYDFKKY